ncbi:MAG TPA: STAS domain-containing protein [Rudaea sp.]|jgi:anti-anti-sigma factor
MSIEIRHEEQGEVRILVLSGRLDTETSADLELALQDLQAAGATQFVIDLGEIGYVSSAGLRVLLALAKQLDGGHGSLKLCALNDAVKQVFDVAGFSKLFAIFPDRGAALATLAPACQPAAPAPASSLARQAATLLGAGDSSTAADPASVALADSAARLLGAEKAAKGASEPAKPKAPARAIKPAAPPAAAADPTPAPAGVLGKFRNLFGSKK